MITRLNIAWRLNKGKLPQKEGATELGVAENWITKANSKQMKIIDSSMSKFSQHLEKPKMG